MVAQCNEQVKEQFASPHFHLHLHSAASLKSLATSDDQGQEMSPQLGVVVRSVLVGVPSGSQDHINLDSRLQSLLPKSKALQFVQTELFCRTIDESILEDIPTGPRMEDARFGRSTAVVFGGRILQSPSVALLVVEEPRVVVSFVKIFEDRGEDLGYFVRQLDPSCEAFVALATESGSKVGRCGEDVLMAGKQALVNTHHQCDDGASEIVCHRRTFQTLLHLHPRLVTKRSLGRLDRLARTIHRAMGPLEHLGLSREGSELVKERRGDKRA